MHRKCILKLLSNYRPCDQHDAEQCKRICTFVAENANCFERSLSIGHITASSWLVNATGDSVLLTHHRKLERWVQLGGHTDGNSDVLAVAIKEAQEESGIQDIKPLSDEVFDVDVHEIPARMNEPAHFHYDIRFLLTAPLHAAFTVSSESHELAWVRIEELERFSQEESVLRMGRKWLNGLSY